ncbi:MAG: hypothetical protein LC659_10705, partial [Myxococcales bacterium]|nr:hypothetical protein [Myxococcales bacterium]
HYRYHPLAARVREILDAREIGRVRRVETWLCLPLPKLSDIRYNHAFAGGALMDAAATPWTWRALSAEKSPRWSRRRRSCTGPPSIARCAPSCCGVAERLQLKLVRGPLRDALDTLFAAGDDHELVPELGHHHAAANAGGVRT